MKTNENHLHETACLVRFSTKFWSGIKSDKMLREALANNVKANDELLNVQKHLVGNSHSKYFRKIVNKVRNEFYYPMTLPWDDSSNDCDGKVVSGWRLCPSTELDILQKHMDEAKHDFYKEVDGFIRNYPRLKLESKELLGDAWNEFDYPHPEEVREKFVFEFDINTLPKIASKNDIRLNVSEKLRSKIENDISKRIKNNIANSSKVVVQTLIEQVTHLANKVKTFNPKDASSGFFKESSIDKLRQAISVLPSFNNDVFGNDEDIAKAHQNLVLAMSKIENAKSLKEDSDSGKKKRDDVAKDLDDAIDPIKGGFMDKLGGAK